MSPKRRRGVDPTETRRVAELIKRERQAKEALKLRDGTPCAWAPVDVVDERDWVCLEEGTAAPIPPDDEET